MRAVWYDRQGPAEDVRGRLLGQRRPRRRRHQQRRDHPAYATRDERPGIPFWPMLFDNATIRLLGSDDFPAAAKQHAARDLTALAAAGGLVIGVAEPLPLAEAARAHDQVDADNRRRVLLAVGSA